MQLSVHGCFVRRLKLDHPEPARELYERAIGHPRLSDKLRAFAQARLDAVDEAIAQELVAQQRAVRQASLQPASSHASSSRSAAHRRGHSLVPQPNPAAFLEPPLAAPATEAVSRLRGRYGDEDLLYHSDAGAVFTSRESVSRRESTFRRRSGVAASSFDG